MEANCINCKKEISIQKVVDNYNLCYLCNYDLSRMIRKEEKIRKGEYMEDIKSVKIIDFDMPFGSMVSFIFKWTLASFPTILLIWVLSMIVIESFM